MNFNPYVSFPQGGIHTAIAETALSILIQEGIFYQLETNEIVGVASSIESIEVVDRDLTDLAESTSTSATVIRATKTGLLKVGLRFQAGSEVTFNEFGQIIAVTKTSSNLSLPDWHPYNDPFPREKTVTNVVVLALQV